MAEAVVAESTQIDRTRQATANQTDGWVWGEAAIEGIAWLLQANSGDGECGCQRNSIMICSLWREIYIGRHFLAGMRPSCLPRRCFDRLITLVLTVEGYVQTRVAGQSPYSTPHCMTSVHKSNSIYVHLGSLVTCNTYDTCKSSTHGVILVFQLVSCSASLHSAAVQMEVHSWNNQTTN